MTPAQAHARLERALVRALCAPDPVEALRRASKALPVELRRAIQNAATEDGVRMAALLSARLRFERLMRGSPDAEEWFERDPEAFAEAFRRYHAEVPPRAFFPQGEARLFARWREGSRRRRP